MTFEEWWNMEIYPGAGSNGDNYVEDLCHGCSIKDVKEALQAAYWEGFNHAASVCNPQSC